jgi:hypothetical protein
MLVFKCLSVKIGLITWIRKTLTDFNRVLRIITGAEAVCKGDARPLQG